MRERGTEIGREKRRNDINRCAIFFHVSPTLFGICRHLNTLLNIIFRLRLYFALLFPYKHSCIFWKIEQFWCATFYTSHLYHGKYVVLLTFDCIVEYFFPSRFIYCLFTLFVSLAIFNRFCYFFLSILCFLFACGTNNHFKCTLNEGLHIHLLRARCR